MSVPNSNEFEAAWKIVRHYEPAAEAFFSNNLLELAEGMVNELIPTLQAEIAVDGKIQQSLTAISVVMQLLINDSKRKKPKPATLSLNTFVPSLN